VTRYPGGGEVGSGHQNGREKKGIGRGFKTCWCRESPATAKHGRGGRSGPCRAIETKGEFKAVGGVREAIEGMAEGRQPTCSGRVGKNVKKVGGSDQESIGAGGWKKGNCGDYHDPTGMGGKKARSGTGREVDAYGPMAQK